MTVILRNTFQQIICLTVNLMFNQFCSMKKKRKKEKLCKIKNRLGKNVLRN